MQQVARLFIEFKDEFPMHVKGCRQFFFSEYGYPGYQMKGLYPSKIEELELKMYSP